ncbi:MAG: PAS domain S-box protein, partial [Desulfomonilaceae bacterium]
MGTVVDITERKRAEAALHDSETLFRTFVDHAGDALFMLDFERRTILDVNRCACESLGYTRQELIGMTPLEFDVNLDRTSLESTAAQAAAGGTVAFDRHWHRRRDGTLFPVEVQTSAFWHGGRRLLLKVARDITERLRAEEAIRQSEKELRDVIQTMPSIALTNRPDGSVEFVNQRWQDYTGMSVEESTGSGWQCTIHPQDLDGYLEKRRAAIASGKPYEGEFRIRCGATGEYRWFLSRVVPLRDERGNILRWYGTVTDIDDRKRVEERLQHENVALREEIDKSSMFEEIVGSSAALRATLSRVAKVAPSDST